MVRSVLRFCSAPSQASMFIRTPTRNSKASWVARGFIGSEVLWTIPPRPCKPAPAPTPPFMMAPLEVVLPMQRGPLPLLIPLLWFMMVVVTGWMCCGQVVAIRYELRSNWCDGMSAAIFDLANSMRIAPRSDESRNLPCRAAIAAAALTTSLNSTNATGTGALAPTPLASALPLLWWCWR
uniref:Uncharacterized protein n=1 Tax=Anopheles atroparvus TaxID=41427 RepID=A0A182JN79_ANOAO